jgi:two-component system, NtrC family, response regulator AtoC
LPVAELDADTVVCLQEHTWPGNVRELERVMQSSVIMSRGQAIRPHHLPEQLASASNNIVGIDGHSAGGSFDEQLANFKLRLARSAVRKNGGNKTLEARRLNISRPYLQRLLRIESEDQILHDCSRAGDTP